MGEDCAFRYAGGAAGVLQKRNIVEVQVEWCKGEELAGPQRFSKRDGVGQFERRHLVANETQYEVGEDGTRKSKQITHAGDHDMLDGRRAAHFLKDMREIP